jgi:hypothetical protein
MDECNSCTRLGCIISDLASTPEQVHAATQELSMHNNTARDQRRVIASFTKAYIRTLVPGAVLPERLLPDHIDDPANGDNAVDALVAGAVFFTAEDFGGGIACPHFGFRRASKDYYLSNLVIRVFVQCDISHDRHHVTLYDERLITAEGEAMCTLRFCGHLHHRQQCRSDGVVLPSVHISARDNCVGQNKSNITCKFDCLMSMLFYNTVLAINYLPGHSHMVCNRVTSHVKATMKRSNLFTPMEFVTSMNDVSKVTATFLDHRRPDRLVLDGWKDLLDKYISDMPNGFTKNSSDHLLNNNET